MADDMPDIDLDNLDDLLQALSAEEIEELNGDFDPDNSMLPASQRCKNQTEKDPTGQFSRQKLLQFLEDKAKHEKDWENKVAFTKETRGKKFVPKVEAKTIVNADDEATETEWDDILTAATEEELVDLAAVLGFHSMLTQTQYHASLEGREIHEGGFSDVSGCAQAQKLRAFNEEAPNMTDVEDSINKLKANDPQLKSLNLNNIKNVSIERLIEVCEAVKDNTVLVKLEMASVDATDRVAKAMAKSLEDNKTLKSLNMESNFISGESIVELVKAANKQQVLLEIRVANQKPELLGNKCEMAIAELLKENSTLLMVSCQFEYPGPRLRIHEKLKNNLDLLRQKRSPTENGES